MSYTIECPNCEKMNDSSTCVGGDEYGTEYYRCECGTLFSVAIELTEVEELPTWLSWEAE